MAKNQPRETSPLPKGSLSVSAQKADDTGAADGGNHLELLRDVSQVPGNPHYYEKDGLRTYGDDEDHDHEPPVIDSSMTIRYPALIVRCRCRCADCCPLLLWRSYSLALRSPYIYLVSHPCHIGEILPDSGVGGVPPYIYGDIGGTDRWTWFVLANLLSLAAVCPFVGALSDLLGRRYVALAGASFIILGMIVCSTAQNMDVFIGQPSSLCYVSLYYTNMF